MLNQHHKILMTALTLLPLAGCLDEEGVDDEMPETTAEAYCSSVQAVDTSVNLAPDETYAVSDADFVGKDALVSVGPLDQGLPGKVRLKDVFGNWHTLNARASTDSTDLPVGASVLLVDRDARCFIAISAPADLITQQQTSRRA
jgi:hypothetical protein